MPGAGRLRALPAARPGDCTVPGCSAQLLLLLLAAVCTEPALGRTDASAGIAEELARGRRERGGAPGWLPTARLLAQGNCSGASLAGAEGSAHRVCGCGVSRAPTWGCGSCGSWRRLAAPHISLRMLWGQLPQKICGRVGWLPARSTALRPAAPAGQSTDPPRASLGLPCCKRGRGPDLIRNSAINDNFHNYLFANSLPKKFCFLPGEGNNTHPCWPSRGPWPAGFTEQPVVRAVLPAGVAPVAHHQHVPAVPEQANLVKNKLSSVLIEDGQKIPEYVCFIKSVEIKTAYSQEIIHFPDSPK